MNYKLICFHNTSEYCVMYTKVYYLNDTNMHTELKEFCNNVEEFNFEGLAIFNIKYTTPSIFYI